MNKPQRTHVIRSTRKGDRLIQRIRRTICVAETEATVAIQLRRVEREARSFAHQQDQGRPRRQIVRSNENLHKQEFPLAMAQNQQHAPGRPDKVAAAAMGSTLYATFSVS